MKKMLTGLCCSYFFSLFSATFFIIDTTTPIQCFLSSKFLNRIMIQEHRIKKIITSESERLSIQMEEFTGQAFIYARDPNLWEASISVIGDNGVVQDLQIRFIEKAPEVVILKSFEEEEEKWHQTEQKIVNTTLWEVINEISKGKNPPGFIPCPIDPQVWKPKKGIEMELKQQYEGPSEILYIYSVKNILRKEVLLLECELECQNCQWVFLESNHLKPKQKILSVISVAKNE